MNQKPFYLTTTLPYVNANLHMGHALEFVRADAIVRYKKLNNFDVYFNTGTDEHGMKIYEKAQSQNLTAQEFVDQSFKNFSESVNIFGLAEDIHFIRTTDKRHEKIAQSFWMKCKENGYIYKKNYQTKYCVGCESEKSDSELVNGECPDHPGRALEVIEEENYFFKYSEFTEKLTDFYNSNPNFVIPDFRYNEIKAFVSRGLQDFSISRLATKMPWGIPVPDDSLHVMYVWFDALTNYISTLADEGVETLDQLIASDKFQKYWVNGTPTQYCGKDNLRFQSAMWQSMLMAAGVPNSHQIIINGFITAEGGLKMSKTLGNVVDPQEIVAEYGTDALRYFLLREVSSFEDSPFTIERFKDSYNSGLANGLGNLVSRVMKMATTYGITITDLPTYEESLKSDLSDGDVRFCVAIDNFDIKKGLDILWTRLQIFDGIIQMSQPFKKLKSDNFSEKEEGINCVKDIMRGLYSVSLLLESILPETSIKIQNLIKENKMPETPLFLRKD